MTAYLRHVLAVTAVVFAPLAHADYYLVVQSANPQPSLTQKEAVDLFMGRNRAFRNGDLAQVYDLPRDSAVRSDFYQRLTGMGPAQVNSYWARLMFSGQTMPPQSVVDEGAMLETVKRTPGAIGWVRKEPADKQLRVVLVIKEST
jgi:hypothetical protein